MIRRNIKASVYMAGEAETAKAFSSQGQCIHSYLNPSLDDWINKKSNSAESRENGVYFTQYRKVNRTDERHPLVARESTTHGVSPSGLSQSPSHGCSRVFLHRHSCGDFPRV